MTAALLGDVVQICVVTSDIRRTIDGYLRMGIGPWRVQTLGPDSTTDTRFRVCQLI
ncbi:hypothetical protein [Streptomyces sp. NPDC059455]|uniref:hypothetical protein n=1 Tax=Streptomyces sp. NPDC059455 TaxID=3346837 RepID=UPI0036C1983F